MTTKQRRPITIPVTRPFYGPDNDSFPFLLTFFRPTGNRPITKKIEKITASINRGYHLYKIKKHNF